MRRILLATGVAIALTAAPALAVEPTLGATLGTTPDAIAAALRDSGYDMTEYEREGGRVEVDAVKEDRRVEIEIDAETGQVVKLESRLRRGETQRAGVDDAEVRANLQAQGYEITKYERERQEIEVYATRDGRRWELKIDPRTGDIVKAEEE